MELVQLGTITGTHGLDGTVKAICLTDFGELRYQAGNQVMLRDKNNEIVLTLTVKEYRHSGRFDFITFEELTNPEDAIKYKGFDVVIDKKDAFIPEGFYAFMDLEKCDVYDEDNNLLGHVTKVEEYPAQDTLRVKGVNGKEFMVPFVDEFIKDVNLENKKIVIHVIGGMI